MPASLTTAHRTRLAALVTGAALIVAACSSDEPNQVIQLGEDGFAPSADDIQSDAAVGSEVDIEFATFDGGTANFTDFAGTPLVINFFARTCPACVSEMPAFDRVFRDLDGSATILGISTDPRQQDAEILLEETGVTYPVGWDPDGDIFARFGGFAMPTTVFVTADGVVQETWSGVLTEADLAAKIDDLS